MPQANRSTQSRKRQWRRTLAGLTCILAILGILVVEGLRRHQPDALAIVAFALMATVWIVLARRTPEAGQ